MTAYKLNYLLFFTGLLLIGVFSSCDKDPVTDPGPVPVAVSNLQITNNPSGYAPLTARIQFSTDQVVTVQIRIIGRNGPASDIVHTFPERANSFDLPVLGLYDSHRNEVELTFLDENGQEMDREIIEIQTGPLIDDLPEIVIDERSTSGRAEGLIIVNYFGYSYQPVPQRPFMLDDFGDIRWYLDYSEHPLIPNLFYDNGTSLLANGNMVFGDRNTGQLYEIDMLGNILNSWSLFGLAFHHTVIEKPNGNFLVTVDDYSKTTVEDVIIEVDRNSGEIVNRWDIDLVMDKERRTWDSDRGNLEIDWFHANGLAYSEADDCIIVSGRTQGVVKLTKDNEIVWILAPHKEWGTAPDGKDLNQFLLQPLDAAGNPISDFSVLQGEEEHPDFDWAWYQHSPRLLDNGHLMLFDNGENRHFSNSPPYSRAVEYQIDEDQGTIQQIWSYGKEREGRTYSQVVSSVERLPNGNILFAPGAINSTLVGTGKIIEVDKENKNVLFEATITPKWTLASITFHNARRQSLYAE